LSSAGWHPWTLIWCSAMRITPQWATPRMAELAGGPRRPLHERQGSRPAPSLGNRLLSSEEVFARMFVMGGALRVS
jgi:hypothetical protein